MAKDKSDSGTGEGLFHRIRTGEWPVLKIDLSEAYANVRKRAARLRRRRIISAVVAGVVLAGLGTVVGTYYVSGIPLPSQLNLPVTTTIYYGDGTTVLAQLGSQRRTIVPAASLPQYVARAVIAAEDPRYWVTSGTLISRQYARAATIAEGGSLSGTTAEAKLLVLTWKLEDTYSKEEILEFYLNTVYFGRGSYGIEEAARGYFGVGAAQLTLPQAIVLAGVIESPGDGRFDPSVDPVTASTKFATVAQSMVSMGAIEEQAVRGLRVPTVKPYDPTQYATDLDGPIGLVVAQALAELRLSEAFRDKSASYLVDGGYKIVTTIDPELQELVEGIVDETRQGSLLAPQPRSTRAAAVVVEPGTGRVLAYFGGSNGTGADYAGTRPTADGGVAGFGYHPPAQTMLPYTLVAALRDGISVQSRWDSPATKEFPDSGHTVVNPVRDVTPVPPLCLPACTLAEAAVVPLSIPFYSVTERVGAAAVIDAARDAGVAAMWAPGTAGSGPVRYDLGSRRAEALVPDPFTADVTLGAYPITVLDQATGMATLAAGGRRATTHFVSRVEKGGVTYYEEPSGTTRAIEPEVAADVTAVLATHPQAELPGGTWSSAGMPGTALLAGSALEAAHAWYVGYTPALAVAVWVGNQEVEFPLRDAVGNRISGETLPARIYRDVMAGALQLLDASPEPFPPAAQLGDPSVGDAAAVPET